MISTLRTERGNPGLILGEIEDVVKAIEGSAVLRLKLASGLPEYLQSQFNTGERRQYTIVPEDGGRWIFDAYLTGFKRLGGNRYHVTLRLYGSADFKTR